MWQIPAWIPKKHEWFPVASAFSWHLNRRNYLHWWFAIMTWVSLMKLRRVSSVIDWRSTTERRLSSWSTGVGGAVVASSPSIQWATNRNWWSPPRFLTEGNRRISLNWPIFNFNFKSRGMSVDSSGRQAVMRAVLFVDCAMPQIHPTLSADSLEMN